MDIYTYPHDILRQDTKIITEFGKPMEELAENMLHTMHLSNGVGLAGPQVGLTDKIFVCQAPDEKPWVFINPEIIGTSMEIVPFEEGCLSIPGLYADVDRPAAIQIQAYNVKGRPFKLEAEGYLARIIQHEFDHLKGVLFIDYLKEKKRDKLLKAYDKRMRG
ncbi:peptide deformylase [Spirochaeta cellobiosiphila]|uniref:peptide deformylase n=1 Tax=Spirochaeta cellobiosiphila TaxID=504483 RepID=UPI0003FC34EC|nr:peptide deformylase [Spirochaeta cellobiosiphila]